MLYAKLPCKVVMRSAATRPHRCPPRRLDQPPDLQWHGALGLSPGHSLDGSTCHAEPKQNPDYEKRAFPAGLRGSTAESRTRCCAGSVTPNSAWATSKHSKKSPYECFVFAAKVPRKPPPLAATEAGRPHCERRTTPHARLLRMAKQRHVILS